MKIGRITERYWFVIITIVLCLAFFVLRSNQKEQFAKINTNYEEKTAVNLSKDFEPQTLANLLVEHNYIPDDTSALVIANHIKSKLAEGKTLPNLGELNKRTFRIPASYIDSLGGSYLKNRVKNLRELLGITGPLPTTAENAFDLKKIAGDPGSRKENCEITVKVQEFDSTANWLLKKMDKNLIAVPNVLIQIKEHHYDSISNAQEIIIGYAMTNEKGIAVFKGLNADGYYSVLPIKQGFEYGKSQGTIKGDLQTTIAKSFFDKIKSIFDNETNFTFTQREHSISPFDTYVYANLKEDNAITVRIPQEFQSKLVSNLIFILLAWWILHFYLVIRKKKTDQFFLPLIMTLSGICLLTMHSIHNPLTDKMLGDDMAQGILWGIVLIGALSEIDFVTFFNSNYRFLGKFGGLRSIHFDIVRLLVIRFAGIFGKKIKNWVSKLPEGGGYLILAFLLTLLLFPFGTSPQAGVKINLFFFQPGEIVKYMIVLFLAAFFYKNMEKIQTFSRIVSTQSFRIQFRTIITVIVSLGTLLLMYLALGDMGPALVIAGTFIIIYSFVRQDLPQLLFGVATFTAFLLAAKWVVPNSQLVMFAFAMIWLLGWIFYGFKIHKEKQFFESAIFLNLVIAAFIFGSNLPIVGERLQARNDIYADIWNNEVSGGDQIAQGLWGLASGGAFGQGLGEGNPNLVPAFHTDMIFTSVGEQMGWLGLLLVVLCMAVLLYRSLLIGKRAGHPFTFYLAVGIAIITGVQFLIITLGSVGIIPLTGVAVPFLSYGKVSMIMNMLAFGIIFSISNNRAEEYQKKKMEDDKGLQLMIDTCKYGYTAFAVVLLGTLFWYQFIARDSTLIRPALMSNMQGARIVGYNPRIRLLMKELNAGNIYDRNGILLATNDVEQINNQLDKYIKAGVAKDIYTKELKQRKRRYYPFGENLFFWLGDFNNTNILWNDSENDPRGYIAERRHLADLRGFDNLKYDKKGNIQQFNLTSQKFKADNATFLEPIQKDYKYTDYDYSFLIPYLKAGINSRKVERFNKELEKRDITLTVDAALQTQIQNEIAVYVANNFKGEKWNKLRISVVVLDAKEGDLLCSANYPLPDVQTLKAKQSQHAYNEKDRREKAYTDRDLGLTYQTPPGSTAKIMSALAGLQKLGTTAANKTYSVNAKEAIELNRKGVPIEPTGIVSMNDAIVKSSNNYFINLVNDQKLYENLDSIYQSVGIRIDKSDTKIVNGKTKMLAKPLTPYFFTSDFNNEKKAEYKANLILTGNKCIEKYENYVEKRNKNPKHSYFEKMNNGKLGWLQEHNWAWGQGTMSATPLNMARIASIVVNDGNFVETQFIKKGNETMKVEKQKNTRIVSEKEANILKGYMTKEAMVEQKRRNKISFSHNIGGKTGTPERELRYVKYDKKGEPLRNSKGKIRIYTQTLNDGWYIFFTNSKEPLAVAVRMERLSSKGSGRAVDLTDKVVLKVLDNLGYLND